MRWCRFALTTSEYHMLRSFKTRVTSLVSTGFCLAQSQGKTVNVYLGRGQSGSVWLLKAAQLLELLHFHQGPLTNIYHLTCTTYKQRRQTLVLSYSLVSVSYKVWHQQPERRWPVSRVWDVNVYLVWRGHEMAKARSFITLYMLFQNILLILMSDIGALGSLWHLTDVELVVLAVWVLSGFSIF